MIRSVIRENTQTVTGIGQLEVKTKQTIKKTMEVGNPLRKWWNKQIREAMEKHQDYTFIYMNINTEDRNTGK